MTTKPLSSEPAVWNEDSKKADVLALPTRVLRSLNAIVSALLPALSSSQHPEDWRKLAAPAVVDAAASKNNVAADNNEAQHRFWTHDLTTDSSYVRAISLVIQTNLSTIERLPLLFFLYAISTPIGSALFFHSWFAIWHWKAFSEWDVQRRVRALQQMSVDPYWSARRKIFSGLKPLICGGALSYVVEQKVAPPSLSTAAFHERRSAAMSLNPFWEAMGYPGPIHYYEKPEDDQRFVQEATRFSSSRDFSKNGSLLVVKDGDVTLEYDVVIVGSGAGGGVAAATLSAAGYSVLVMEKGPYVEPENVTNLECHALDTMFEKHSCLTTSDANFALLAGSTLGGGTTINWGCCIDTPTHVRQEWSKNGLTQFRPFSSSNDDNLPNNNCEFDKSLASVKETICCNADNSSTSTTAAKSHNRMNTMFLEGCDALGYQAHATGHNYKNPERKSAGYACFGDRYGNKQGGLATFLSHAAANGAKFIVNCRVHQVLCESRNNVGLHLDKVASGNRKRAVGVVAYVGSHKITVKAKKCVISSAGSLHSPCLLLRSKFHNAHIGKHLHLHPVTVCMGVMEDTNKGVIATSDRAASTPLSSSVVHNGCVHGYLSAPMTTVCERFQQGPDRNGYGALLECPCIHTGLFGAAIPWTDPIKFKQSLLKMKDTMSIIVLQRDCGEGRVTLSALDKSNNPQIEYVLSAADEESMLVSMTGAIRVLIAAGAQFIRTIHNNDNGFQVPNHDDGDGGERKNGDSEELLEQYLRQVKERGMKKYSIGLFSAHQMGSCRMGSSPKTSVVDENGELWECDDMFVMDASVFPTASGANPMLTTLAISHMLSTRLALRLQLEDKKLTSTDDGARFEKALQELAHRKELRKSAPCVRYSVNMFSNLTVSVVVVVAAVMMGWFTVVMKERFASG